MPYLDGFRPRRSSKPLRKIGQSNDNDSDHSSSHDSFEPGVNLHISNPKDGTSHSADRARNIHHSLGMPTPITDKAGSTSRLLHDEVLNEKSSTSHPKQPAEADKAAGLGLLR
jgi:hypothetical protein